MQARVKAKDDPGHFSGERKRLTQIVLFVRIDLSLAQDSPLRNETSRRVLRSSSGFKSAFGELRAPAGGHRTGSSANTGYGFSVLSGRRAVLSASVGGIPSRPVPRDASERVRASLVGGVQRRMQFVAIQARRAPRLHSVLSGGMAARRSRCIQSDASNGAWPYLRGRWAEPRATTHTEAVYK